MSLSNTPWLAWIPYAISSMKFNFGLEKLGWNITGNS